MGRETGQLPRRPPKLTSRFDLLDEDEPVVLDQDFTASVQELAALIVELIETPGGPTGVVFTEDFVVKLTNGKTFGKYTNGQTVPAANKTPREVLLDMAIEYFAPAVTALTSATLIKTFEVGESFPAGIVAVAYAISNGENIKTQPPKVGVLLTDVPDASFPSNPITLAASGNFNITIPADTHFIEPDNLLISLTGTNSQDAEFSGTGTIKGRYKIFYGPSAEAPEDSADVRALPSSRFSAETTLGDSPDSTFLLNTGTTEKVFAVALPPGKTLVSVFDLDALNAPLTTQYQAGLSTFNVNDANGSPHSTKVYTLENDGPYSTNHRHQITIGNA